jgi:heptosyltransferase-2
MAEKRGKILVIRGGAIGDFILTLPAIAALRTAFPETHLEVLGYPAVAELARAAQIIDAFRSIEARALARFFARNADLDPEWSRYFESFNVILSYLYDPDEIFKTNIARVSKAQFIQGTHRPNESEPLHATAVFLKPLERLAIFDADPLPRLAIPRDPKLPGERWLAMHPGSGSPSKNWPEENWRELIERMLALTDANILMAGGEAEGDKLARLARGLPPERSRVAQNLSLIELARLIAQCRAFVGHDSGITHLAAALGVPSVVLWGPSNEQIWRPPHSHVHVIKSGDGIARIAVDEAVNAVHRLWRSQRAS